MKTFIIKNEDGTTRKIKGILSYNYWCMDDVSEMIFDHSGGKFPFEKIPEEELVEMSKEVENQIEDLESFADYYDFRYAVISVAKKHHYTADDTDDMEERKKLGWGFVEQ